MGFEYLIIIGLVVALAGFVIYKNKRVPQVFYDIREFAVKRIEDDKEVIILRAYDELPVSVKAKIDRETYQKIGKQLLDYSIKEIKKDLLKP